MFKEKKKGVTRLTGSALQAWPVGAVYLSYTNSDPAVLFGGTWTRIAQGRMLVGLNESDTDFDTPGDTGGAKTHTLSAAEMPAHVHTVNRSTGTGAGTAGNLARGSTDTPATVSTGVGTTGGSDPHNNMPPFLTIYMWRRTA